MIPTHLVWARSGCNKWSIVYGDNNENCWDWIGRFSLDQAKTVEEKSVDFCVLPYGMTPTAEPQIPSSS